MTAGIYRLTFRDGSFYIGKSVDLAKRWDQHARSMLKGTHAKKLQAAFDRYGEPIYEVIIRCHEDHIDTLEGIFINSQWSNNILNTTRPRMISEIEWEAIQLIPTEMWINGPIHNLTQIRNLKDTVSELQDDIINAEEAFQETLAEIKSGTALEDAEDRIEFLRKENNELSHNNRILKDQIHRMQNRGFFARLFNT